MHFVDCYNKNIYLKDELIGYINGDGHMYVYHKPIGFLHERGDVVINGQKAGYISSNGEIYFRGSIKGYLGPGSDLIFEELLGHASISTTEIYTRVDTKQKKKILNKYNYRNKLFSK